MAAFVAACRAEVLSERTIEFYLEGLNAYPAFAGAEDHDLTLADLDLGVARAWLADFVERGRKPATVAARARALAIHSTSRPEAPVVLDGYVSVIKQSSDRSPSYRGLAPQFLASGPVGLPRKVRARALPQGAGRATRARDDREVVCRDPGKWWTNTRN